MVTVVLCMMRDGGGGSRWGGICHDTFHTPGCTTVHVIAYALEHVGNALGSPATGQDNTAPAQAGQ